MNKWKMFLCLYIAFIFLSSDVVFCVDNIYKFDKEVAAKDKILTYLNREDVSNNKKIRFILYQSQKINGFEYGSIVWDILLATAIATVDTFFPTDIGSYLNPKVVNELLSKLDEDNVYSFINKLQANGWIQLDRLNSRVKNKWMNVYEKRMLSDDYRAQAEIFEVLNNQSMSFDKKRTNILQIINKLSGWFSNEVALEIFEAFFDIDSNSNIESREDGFRYIDKDIVNAILNKTWNVSVHYDKDLNYRGYELVTTLKDRGLIDFQALDGKFKRRWYSVDAKVRNERDLEDERAQRQRDRNPIYHFYTTDMLNMAGKPDGGCKNLFSADAK